MATGFVSLVGAGPGDPELLTLKAQRRLGEADVVVYDRLVGDEILDMVPAGAARIYVGKSDGHHAVPQDEINDLLVRLARAGRRVVRLKGGDPFVFGRGSEEAAWLARHCIDHDVVPGITAAAGCAAAVGVPLTHRGLASGVRFVTGHAREDGALDLDWRGLADADTTLVIYMGRATIRETTAKLVAEGLPAATPAVAIANGTTPGQRTCRATLGTLAGALSAAGFSSPVLVVIGRVVSLMTAGATSDALELGQVGHG